VAAAFDVSRAIFYCYLAEHEEEPTV